jgi:hypothetical protein
MVLMKSAALVFLLAVATAAPAAADIRFLAFDAADRVTQALTRGVTLEVERGLFGAVAVRRIVSTTQRGEARIERGGPDAVRGVLPEGSRGGAVYAIPTEGQARGLVRALCPAADAAWLVAPRVRAGRPLTMEAVGRWADGQYRHCVTLSYTYRGEWAAPPRGRGEAPADRGTPSPY